MHWSGQNILVTGASSGIGEALARELASGGGNLVLAARRVDRLEALAEELRAMRRKVLVVRCDVTRDGDLEALVERAHGELGPLNTVVANAGFGVAGKLARLAIEDYRRQFETNVFGVLRTVYATLEDLKATRGRLAVLGSVSGYVSGPTLSPYSMSKFAVRALCEALHSELGAHGISVTLLSPGFIASEIRQVGNSGELNPGAKDPVPSWLVMPSDRAARQIARAIWRRKRERIVTVHGRLLIWLRQFTPWLYFAGVRLSRRRLQGAADRPGKQAVSGKTESKT